MLDYLAAEFFEASKTDDVIAFRLADLLVSANLSKALIARLSNKLVRTNMRVGGMMGVIALLCKYGDPDKITEFVKRTVDLWSSNEFLSRQIISLWSILAPTSKQSEEARLLITRAVSSSCRERINLLLRQSATNSISTRGTRGIHIGSENEKTVYPRESNHHIKPAPISVRRDRPQRPNQGISFEGTGRSVEGDCT